MGIFVDRHSEMKRVDRLICDTAHDRRIAVVRAVGGMGKTALLQRIYDRYRSSAAAVLMDLRQPYELGSLLDGIADQLVSQGIELQSYRKSAEHQVTVQLSNVRLRGSSFNLSVDNATVLRQEADRLLHELLEDIAQPASPRHLVLLDHWDAAGDPLKDWLCTSLIPGFLFRSSAICVLAGRRDLYLGHPQECRTDRLQLRELDEDSVRQWLVEAGLPHMLDHADIIWKGTSGVPADVQKFIAGLIDHEDW